jgi:hypothetical protein
MRLLRWSIQVRSIFRASEPLPQIPLLERQAFWGAIGAASMLIGLFLAWALKDFRWALWLSWPLWGWAVGIAAGYIPAQKIVRRLMLLLGFVIIGVALLAADRRFSPKNAPEATQNIADRKPPEPSRSLPSPSANNSPQPSFQPKAAVEPSDPSDIDSRPPLRAYRLCVASRILQS